MIDLEHNRVIRGDALNEPIKRWVTWFKTPFGYVETVAELLELTKKHELDPNMVAFPVPVAIGESNYEVWER